MKYFIVMFLLIFSMKIGSTKDTHISLSEVIGGFYISTVGSSMANYLVPLSIESVSNNRIKIGFATTTIPYVTNGNINLIDNKEITYVMVNCEDEMYSAGEGDNNFDFKEYLQGRSFHWGEYNASSSQSLDFNVHEEYEDEFTNLLRRSCLYMKQF